VPKHDSAAVEVVEVGAGPGGAVDLGVVAAGALRIDLAAASADRTGMVVVHMAGYTFPTIAKVLKSFMTTINRKVRGRIIADLILLTSR
jgi:hypothetical protein